MLISLRLLYREREGYLGNARVALERIDCFIDIANYTRMLDADYMVGWDCIKWGCSLLVCHGYKFTLVMVAVMEGSSALSSVNGIIISIIFLEKIYLLV